MSDFRLVFVPSSSSGRTIEPITLGEAKQWLLLEEEETDADVVIGQLIVTARQRYEALTNRQLVKGDYDWFLDDVCHEVLVPPKYPLVSVGSIRAFTDTDATDTGGTSMSSSEFYVDTASEPGRIVPVPGYTFPVGTRAANAYIVRFSCGYSTESTGIPSDAKTTLGKMIARAWEFRGDQSAAEQEALMDECVRDEFTVQDWG